MGAAHEEAGFANAAPRGAGLFAVAQLQSSVPQSNTDLSVAVMVFGRGDYSPMIIDVNEAESR